MGTHFLFSNNMICFIHAMIDKYLDIVETPTQLFIMSSQKIYSFGYVFHAQGNTSIDDDCILRSCVVIDITVSWQKKLFVFLAEWISMLFFTEYNDHLTPLLIIYHIFVQLNLVFTNLSHIFRFPSYMMLNGASLKTIHITLPKKNNNKRIVQTPQNLT